MESLDRRQQFRARGWFAVRVHTGDDEATTVAQNVADGGLLLVSRKPIDVGRRVHLSLHVSPGKEAPWMVPGRVIRASPNTADPAGLWPHRIAIAFDEAMPEVVRSAQAAA